jgi:hypothetical protein
MFWFLLPLKDMQMSFCAVNAEQLLIVNVVENCGLRMLIRTQPVICVKKFTIIGGVNSVAIRDRM